MIRAALIALLLTGYAAADTGIDFVLTGSDSLGYERSGFGLQIDTDGRVGDWGWDGQFTALKHSKFGGDGERYQTILMGRYFLDDAGWYVEAGGEYGGYETRFDDRADWRKFGYAPGVGFGQYRARSAWGVRWFSPDNTFNRTSVFQVRGEAHLTEHLALGAMVEQWNFDIGAERRKGNMFTVEIGYRW